MREWIRDRGLGGLFVSKGRVPRARRLPGRDRGSSALRTRSARVNELRGRPHAVAPRITALVTLHPSAVLRAGDARAERRAELQEDLTLAAQLLTNGLPALSDREDDEVLTGA